VAAGQLERALALRRREPAPHAVQEHDEREGAQNRHADTIPAGGGLYAPAPPLDSGTSETPLMPELEDHHVETDSLFAEAIREHLDLKARNSELDGDMPLDRYLNGDQLENHPLFKSEEQARIEETMDGEMPAVELSSERLPWPGEETVEDAPSVEGAALDETLWTGRPRDFDWGD
jgi:hypothetical protein